MNRLFSPSSNFINDRTSRKDSRSNMVHEYVRPVEPGGRSSYVWMRPDGPFPATTGERWTHFRMSFRRIVITFGVIFGIISLLVSLVLMTKP